MKHKGSHFFADNVKPGANIGGGGGERTSLFPQAFEPLPTICTILKYLNLVTDP